MSAVLAFAFGLALTLSGVVSTIQNGIHPDLLGLHAGEADVAAGRPFYSTVVDGTVNLNPPHVLVALVPLGLLTPPLAVVAWWLLSAWCAWWCVRVWRTVLPAPVPFVALSVALVTFAGYSSARFGTWTWPLAALGASAWAADRSGRDKAVGMLLAVVASIRVFALLFVPYLLWRHKWRAALTMGVTGLLIWGVGLVTAGPQAYSTWIASLGGITWQGDPYNVSLLGLSHRLFGFSPFEPAIPIESWVTPFWLVASALVMGVTAWRLHGKTDPDREWCAVLLTSLLLSPLAWNAYLPLLGGPLAALWVRRRQGWLLAVALACLVLPTREMTMAMPRSAMVGLTIGSLHLWATLAIWWYCVRADQSSHSWPSSRAGGSAAASG